MSRLETTTQAVEAEVRAPAKLNLLLHVVGRRSDGFHLLEMLNCTLSLCDRLLVRVTKGCSARVRLTLSPSSSVSLPPQDVEPTRNLASRAAIEFLNRFAIEASVEIELIKHIPCGAGLGGGSSDAAAVLRFLATTLGIVVDDPRFSAVALSLGSDVPYFVRGGACRVGGIGEQLSSISAPFESSPVMLVIPPWPLSTPAVYARFKQLNPEGTDFSGRMAVAQRGLNEVCRSMTPAQAARPLLHNDLLPAAEALSPELNRLRAVFLEECDLELHLTGSGSALYALNLDLPNSSQALAIQKVAERFGAKLLLTELSA